MLSSEREKEIQGWATKLAPKNYSKVRDLLAEIDRLRSPWVPVGERLPEDGTLVAISWSAGRGLPEITRYDTNYKDPWMRRGIGQKHRQWNTPSHWTPLPEPPEVG